MTHTNLLVSLAPIKMGCKVDKDKETTERKRERLRQEELKRNPSGNMNDAFNRADVGGLVDFVGSLGWKGTGFLILVIIIGYVIASLFLN